MYEAPDILMMAYKQPVMQDQLTVLYEKEQQIPGSVQYTIKRHQRHPQWNLDDLGMMVYHYRKEDPARNYLELRFCLAGNVYCKKKEIECACCRLDANSSMTRSGCSDRIDTVDVVSFRFLAVHLSQFVRPRRLPEGSAGLIGERGSEGSVGEDILNFRHASSFSKVLSLCGRTRMVLETLLNHHYTDSLENIFINAQSQMLLLYSLECMVGEKEVEGFQCKFLANEADRDKIVRAREVLLQHIGEPLTIKELSRKVAINECYLKKGFKEMFGTTIFDFYQGQRMEHARYLLYEKGLSVTEVSVMLGYSSISHFSTAFKKHTGLKPCELLLHA
jgi:AraC-like DNA-binding protein